MLSIGIVGLPNVGKSTLFNALTNKCVPTENYPFCTIEPSVGVVPIPDDRLEKLSQLSNSARAIPAAIEFIDIAGLVKGAASGEGLGNKFLSHIREVDAILELVRIFPLEGECDDIAHVHGKIDPLHDIEVINLELVLADLEMIAKRIQKIAKEVKGQKAEAKQEQEVLLKIEKVLEKNQLAKETELSQEELDIAKRFNLLTLKPIIYALNKKAGIKNLDETSPQEFEKVIKFIEETNSRYVVIDAKIEDELKEMSPEEKMEFRKELGVENGGINKLIEECHKLLGLITFFTMATADEVRAWAVKEGSTAPQAGAAVHTDFRDKFIRAEVINWKDLVDASSLAKAREKGLLRIEGKDYIVRDGDVIFFKI